MHYQEAPYPSTSGPIPWGTGHVLLFRTEAMRAVGGFDESRRKAGEDVDICFRIAAAGWEVHFVAETGAVSMQHDSLPVLARAEYNRSVYRAETGNGFWRGLGIAANRMIQRSLRHVIFGRWSLLLVEPGVFYHQLPRIWRQR
jgi:GT2 family glycosyltransferase